MSESSAGAQAATSEKIEHYAAYQAQLCEETSEEAMLVQEVHAA